MMVGRPGPGRGGNAGHGPHAPPPGVEHAFEKRLARQPEVGQKGTSERLPGRPSGPRVRPESGRGFAPIPAMIPHMSASLAPHRFCVAPMMGCTDRHARYLLRLLSRPRAALYGDDPDRRPAPRRRGAGASFRCGRAPGGDPVGRQRSRGPRPVRAPRRGGGIRRGQPQRGLPEPARAEGVLRGRPHGAARPRRRGRRRHAGDGIDTDHGQDPYRDRRSRQLCAVSRLHGDGRRGRVRHLHRSCPQGVAERGSAPGRTARSPRFATTGCTG